MALIGADTDELREVGAEFEQGKETVDEVITYLRALIAILRAASFFSGGASLAYAEYLETTVVPWLQKISQALGLFAKLLSSQAQAQDDTSDGARVDLSSVPSYQTPALPAALAPYAGPPIAGSPTAGDGAVSAGDTGSTLAGGTTQPGTTTAGQVASMGLPTTTGTGTAAGTVPPATAPAALGSLGSIGGIGGGTGAGTGAGTGGGSSLGTAGGSGWSADAPSPGVSTAGGLGSAGGIGGGGSGGSSGDLGTGSGPMSGGGALGSAGGIGGSGSDLTGSSGSTGSTGVTTNPSMSGGLGGATPGSGDIGSLTGSAGAPEGTDSPVGAATIGAAASGAAALGVGGAALAARAGSGGAAGSIESLAASNGRGSRGAEVEKLQQQLTAAGYDTSGTDGRWGGDTERAFQAWRADHPVEVRPGSGYTSPDGFDYTAISGIENTSPQFLREVEAISQRVGAKPEHLLATMSFETGGRFSADVKNPGSSATGLIQFMGDTAKGLGTSTEELRRMTPMEQLPYVEKYLEPHRGRLGDLDSVYSVVLAGHQASGETPLFHAGTKAYTANAPLDLDGNGTITAAEASSHPLSRMRGR